MHKDSRTLRTRQRDAARSALILPPVVPFGTSKCVGTIVNGGSIPTTVDKFALFNPTTLGGTEGEGNAGTFSADTTQKVAGIVMGQAPAVGDVLTFAAISGRWVAYKPTGSGGGGGGITPCLVVFSCVTGIPNVNLTMTWYYNTDVNDAFGNPIVAGPLTTTLTYSVVGANHIWDSGFQTCPADSFIWNGAPCNNYRFAFACGGAPPFTTGIYRLDGTSCTAPAINEGVGFGTPTSCTNTPFMIAFPGNPTTSFNLFAHGILTA